MQWTDNALYVPTAPTKQHRPWTSRPVLRFRCNAIEVRLKIRCTPAASPWAMLALVPDPERKRERKSEACAHARSHTCVRACAHSRATAAPPPPPPLQKRKEKEKGRRRQGIALFERPRHSDQRSVSEAASPVTVHPSGQTRDRRACGHAISVLAAISRFGG